MARIPVRVLGVGLLLLIAAIPAATASDHGGSSSPAGDPCPTDPAYNASLVRPLPADARGEDAVHVDVYDFEVFDPTVVQASEGTCVEWHNEGTLTHTIEITGPAEGSVSSTFVGHVPPGQMTHHVFHEPGTYEIHCEVNAFHEATMHQVVRVG